LSLPLHAIKGGGSAVGLTPPKMLPSRGYCLLLNEKQQIAISGKMHVVEALHSDGEPVRESRRNKKIACRNWRSNPPRASHANTRLGGLKRHKTFFLDAFSFSMLLWINHWF
jgi:hypothetical protein